MIGKIVFTVVAFCTFCIHFAIKMIRKNDTTYLIILGIQAIGILLNLIKISFDIFNGIAFNIILYLFCIITPILVFVLEARGINVSEVLKIIMAQIYLWLNNPKKQKKILIDLVSKYKDSYLGHKFLAKIYEQEGGMRKAIDEYVQVLDIKKDDTDSYYKISVLLRELGRNDEATEMLRTLLKTKPDMYEASKLFGRYIFRTKEFKKQ